MNVAGSLDFYSSRYDETLTIPTAKLTTTVTDSDGVPVSGAEVDQMQGGCQDSSLRWRAI